jgi:hypothetical protein
MLSRFNEQYDFCMHLRHLSLSIALYLLASPFVAGPPAAQQTQATRIVAVGDVHGAYQPFVEILQTAGLIDADRKWAGGKATFVQTGDVFDRGDGVRDALDLLMQLEDEAKRAGGSVEALLGNHEMMNMYGDFRDVSPAVFAAFADARSEDRRQRAYDDYVRLAKRRGIENPTPRDEWLTAHPPGFLEYVEALGPRGKYGKWLRSHKVVANLNGTGFMHAGIKYEMTGTLEDVNRTARSELASWDEVKAKMVQLNLVTTFSTLQETIDGAGGELQRIATMLQEKKNPGDHVTREFVESLQSLLEVGKWSAFSPDGPLWFRGFAQWPDTNEPQVVELLKRMGVRRFVTAHTPLLPGRIKARFGNRIFLIDTGMLSTYFKGGRASALEIQGDQITAIYTTEREVLSGGRP